jgi:hypothetical protein
MMAADDGVSPAFRGWHGWQAKGILPQDVLELRLTLGVIKGRIVASSLELRGQPGAELLGMMSNPSLGGLTPTQASEWLHEWLDEAMDAAEDWADPFR